LIIGFHLGEIRIRGQIQGEVAGQIDFGIHAEIDVLPCIKSILSGFGRSESPRSRVGCHMDDGIEIRNDD